jgi:hypothetical protein
MGECAVQGLKPRRWACLSRREQSRSKREQWKSRGEQERVQKDKIVLARQQSGDR